MFKILILVLVITGAFAENAHPHSHSHHNQGESHNFRHDTSSQSGVLTPEHLRAFRCFSRNLLKQPNYYNAYEQTGAVSYCTYTVGLLLANIQEQVFSVRSAGIVKALELSRENISNAYAAILDSFLEDPNVAPSSTLYTSNKDLVLGPNYQKMHTVVDVLPLHGNPSASSYINRQIGVNTRHTIVDRLVPHDPPFNENAAGVFVNTFYYKNNWEVPFVDIGQTTFSTPERQVQVRTLQVESEFPYIETDHYSSVAVPLAGGRKQVIFVRPKKGMQEYLKVCVEDIFKSNPNTWSKRYTRVQVPYLNLVMGRSFQEQLDALVGSDIACCGRPDSPDEVIDASTRHFIQPVVQVLSARLSAEGYELGVSNGAQVNKRVPHNDKVETPPVQQQAKSLDQHRNEQDILDESGKYSRQGQTLEFVVDSPFFVYLRDNALGAVSFTAIRSKFDMLGDDVPDLPLARHHDVSTDFTEEVKQHRWSCPPRHSH